MSDKFTLRDFLAYFLTGLYLVILITMLTRAMWLPYIDNLMRQCKDLTTFFIFLSVPILYLLGHIIHAIDIIVFEIGARLSDAIDKNLIWLANKKLLTISKIISAILNTHRITQRLKLRALNNRVFWTNCYRLSIKSQYNKAEYWNIMHVLTEGLTLISFMGAILSTFIRDWRSIIICLLLTILFWFRSKLMADNFIKTVTLSSEIIE